jgi:hypothetical protein
MMNLFMILYLNVYSCFVLQENYQRMHLMKTLPYQQLPDTFGLSWKRPLTAKQEFEAKVATLNEKVKQYEAEIAELRLRVNCSSSNNL